MAGFRFRAAMMRRLMLTALFCLFGQAAAAQVSCAPASHTGGKTQAPVLFVVLDEDADSCSRTGQSGFTPPALPQNGLVLRLSKGRLDVWARRGGAQVLPGFGWSCSGPIVFSSESATGLFVIFDGPPAEDPFFHQFDSACSIAYADQNDRPVSLAVQVSSSYDNPARTYTHATGGFTVSTGAYDTSYPTVTLSGPPAMTSREFSVDVTFSEAVDAPKAADFDTTNLSPGALVATGGGTYRLSATAQSDGPVAVSLPENRVTDMNGNGNRASNLVTGQAAPLAGDLSYRVYPEPANQVLRVAIAAPYAIRFGASGPATASGADVVAVGPVDPGGDGFSLTLRPTGQGEVRLTIPKGFVERLDGTPIPALSDVPLGSYDYLDPALVISGLPDRLRAFGDYPLEFLFSEPVTGFTVGDIMVSGGNIGPLSGGPALYRATLTVPPETQAVSVTVAAGAAQDAAGNASREAGRQAALDSAAIAGERIAGFLLDRLNAVQRLQPDLRGFLRGGPGRFSADVSRAGGQLVFHSGTGNPVWASLQAAWSVNQGRGSEYALATLGAHMPVGSGALVGAMFQLDHTANTQAGGWSAGTGWLAGPYVVAPLAGSPLIFDARLLYGKSRNRISPFGTYVDGFETERWLAMAGLSGAVDLDGVRLLPMLELSYGAEWQAGYTDALSNPVPAQRVALGQIAAGLDVALPLSPRTDLTGGMSAIWSLADAPTLPGPAGFTGGRGRVALGLSHRGRSGLSLRLSLHRDGIGAPGLRSTGAALDLGLEF